MSQQGAPEEISHREEILAALREFSDESRLRSTASDPNLYGGRVRVVQVFALDIAELVEQPADDHRRTLQRLRASGQLFDQVSEVLIGKVEGCGLTKQEMAEKRERALRLKGKAVWSEQFIERFSPLSLPVPSQLGHQGRTASLGSRLSNDRQSQLHNVELESAKMQMFRDGTICFTLGTQFIDDGNGEPKPAKTSDIIERLEQLEEVANGCFHSALASLFGMQRVRDQLKEGLQADDHKPVELISPSADLGLQTLKRKAKTHTVIFVERFFDGERIEKLYEAKDYDGCKNNEEAEVPPETVLASSSLAGILNTAKWFHKYNRRYVADLSTKEIGYRDDEIYLTDRKATVVSTKGLWDETDSLSTYMEDIILAVQYNVARLAYFTSTLAYYQAHQDADRVLKSDPMEALKHVVDGRAVLSQIDESLDLTLLVNHGFTRLFVERLRTELGFTAAIEFIRQRIQEASTSVDLRASVEAGASTSKENLEAAKKNLQAAEESLRAAQKNALWAKVAVAVALAVGIGLAALTLALNGDETTTHLDPAMKLCLERGTVGGRALCVVPKNHAGG